MQVEYEDGPSTGGYSAPPPHADEGVESHGHQDGSDREEHDDEGAPGDREPTKKKRVTKARQSLAEKSKGTTIFPLARIKRIIKADKDLDMMSSEATFLVAVATEYFIKHFMEEGYTKARLEQRRIVNYKDMASVVARSEEFDFLADVVPQPMTLTEALERRKQKIVDDDASPAEESEEEEEEEEEEGGGEDAPPRPKAKSRAKPSIKPPADAPALPPLALSTNPLFPNAIVKRPPNTHARGPVPQAPKPAPLPQPPVTPRLTGKNAPSTPHSLTTRGSARRGINAGEVTPETAQERLPDEEEEEEEEEEEDQGEGEGQGEGEEGAEMAEDDSMQVDE